MTLPLRLLAVLLIVLGAVFLLRDGGPPNASSRDAEGVERRSGAGRGTGTGGPQAGTLRGHGSSAAAPERNTPPEGDGISPGSHDTPPGVTVGPQAATADVETMSPDVRRFLEDWAEPAGLVRVTEAGPARGLPRRLRRRRDGGYMVLVPAAQFAMGRSASGQSEVGEDTVPTVQVQLTHAFYVDETEVTVAQWKQYAAAAAEGGLLPDRLAGDDAPVTGVTHEAALAYAAWAGVELPTEAQWELAARGRPGAVSVVFPHDGEGTPSASRFRHWTGRMEGSPLRVAQFKPNVIGLFDVGGNAAEWCRDVYVSDFYRRDLGWPRVDPLCRDSPPATGPLEHVVRGGSWFSPRQEMRVFHRSRRGEDVRGVGLRCVRVTPFEHTGQLPGGSERFGPPLRQPR